MKIKKFFLLTLLLGVMSHAAWADGSKLVTIAPPIDITQMANGESKSVLMYASSGTNYGYVKLGTVGGLARFVMESDANLETASVSYAYILTRNSNGTYTVQCNNGNYLPGWKTGNAGGYGSGGSSSNWTLQFNATTSAISENLLEGGNAFTLTSAVEGGYPVSNSGNVFDANSTSPVALQFCPCQVAIQENHIYTIKPHYSSNSYDDYYLSYNGTALAPNTEETVTKADYWRAVASDNATYPWKFKNLKDESKYLDNANTGINESGSTFGFLACSRDNLWTIHIKSYIPGKGDRFVGTWETGHNPWGFGAQNNAGCFGDRHNNSNWTTDYIIEEIPAVASVDGVLYPTLQDAVDAAQNGDLITVLSESGVDEHTAVSVHGKVVRIQYRTEQRNKIYPADMDGIDAEGAAVWTKVKSGAGQHDIYLGTIVCGDFEKVLDYMHYLNDIVRTPFHNCSYFLLQNVTLSGDHYDPAMGLEQGHYYLSTNVGGSTSSTIRAELETYLDLNGCTIEQADTRGGRDGYALLAVQNNANFTLKDSSDPSTGKLVGSLYCATLDDGATFTLQGGSLITKGQVTATYANEPTWGLIVGQRTTATDSHLILDGGNIVGDLRYPEKEEGNIYPLYCYANNDIVATENCGSITGAPFILGELTVNGGTWEDLYAVNDGTITINDGVFTGDVWDYSQTTSPGHIIIKGGTYTSEDADDLADIDELAKKGTHYRLEDNGDGTYTAVFYNAARIGATEYETLADAVAAVPADGTETTIVMIDDDYIHGNAGVTIPATKNVILDLNGHKVASENAGGATSTLLRNQGTLTIKDTSDTEHDGTGAGQLYSKYATYSAGNTYATNCVSNYGTLTIESGYIESSTPGASYCVDNYDGGNVTINGGHLYNYYTYAVRQFCNSTTESNDLTIDGGVLEGYGAFWLQSPNNNANLASLTISGGQFKTTEKAVVDGTKTIAEGSSMSYIQAKNANVTANISGGQFDTNVYLYSYTDATTFDISGGEFNGYVKDIYACENNPSTITGGKFADDVQALYSVDNKWYYARVISGGVFTATDGMSWPSCVVNDYEDIDNTDPSTQGEYPYTVGLNYIITVTYQNGDVVKRGANNVVINDDNTVKTVEIPNAVDYAQIRYTRTIPPYYQSWYAPFDYVVTAENVEKMTFLKIWSLVIDPNTGLATNVVGKILEPGDIVKGNTPYVVIAKGDAPVEETFDAIGLLTSVSKSIQCETTELRYKFTGTYNALALDTNPYWALGTEGAFGYWSNPGAVENAFRFILRIYDKETDAVIDPHTTPLSLTRIQVCPFGEEDSTTGIHVVMEGEESMSATHRYDLTGRPISTPTQRGIYIVNGKKIIR